MAKNTNTASKQVAPELMAHPVEVRPITGKKEFDAFFKFPWVLYKDDPNWVPPLVSMRRELLDPKKNPAWEYLDGQYYGAWRGDTLVGTITALINHRHNEYWHEHIGWFGTFEVYEDQEAATALLQTAMEWVRAKGYDALRGPQSFTTHEETGLLVENFSRPVILMPYNPPYYQRLIEESGLGFSKAMDLVSFYMDQKLAVESPFAQKLRRLAERTLRDGKITIRTMDGKRKREEFALFREIYNAAWDKNWGFVPMTEKELDALVESLGFFADPNMIFIAEVEGDPAGFAFAVPDFNELLARVKPRPGLPEPITLVQLLYYWKVANIITGLREPFLGVKQQYRNRGIETTLLHYTYESVRGTQFFQIDCGWVLETNTLVDISIKLGAKPYKTHRHYETLLK